MTGPSNGDEPPGRPTEWDPGRGPAEPAPPTSIDPGRVPPAAGTPADRIPPTSIDPERVPRPGRGSAGDAPPATIDAARVDAGRAVPGAPLTAMDPGRVPAVQRPDGSPSDRRTSGVGLPPQLAERFDLLRELQRGAEADVYLVREKATGQERVLKLYEPTWVPDDQVWAYLRSGRPSTALVETVETDRADGRCYELMEYLAGGDLMALRSVRTLEELGPDRVKAIVEQLVDALDELHANGFVHRDLKPTNILLRTLDPEVDVAVVDFGITSAAGQEVKDRNGTPPYTSPQFLAAGSVEPANDMWALGICLIEFFTGTRIFQGLDDPVALKSRVVSAPINTAGVTDERLRMLCTGLTAPAERPRWGSRQVRAWLAGEDPPVPGYQATTDTERPGGAQEPYRYRGVEYRFPDELATAMTITWEDAALTLFGDDPSEPRRLRDWLGRFPDIRWPEGRFRSREPNDVRLLRVLREMHPTHPPIYRNYNIAVSRLPELAREAYEGAGNAPAVVRELSTYKLVPLLARGRQTPELQGGDGLVAVAADWSAEGDRLVRGRAGLPEDARADLERLERESPEKPLAVALLAATATTETRAEVVRVVQRAARRARVSEGDLGWYADMADRADALWLAYLLEPFVTTRIDQVVREAAAARLEREWLMRTQAVREWSRRQNRPQSLAWSVAGVAALATVCGLLIGLSDVVGISSDAMIVSAWLVTVLGLGVVLVGESLLAWEVGGGFHPRYSMLGAGLVGLGRAARSVLARGPALPVVLGVVGGLVVVAVFVPVLMSVAPPVLVPFWAWRRYAAWEADRVREQAAIEQAERERREERSATREGVR